MEKPYCLIAYEAPQATRLSWAPPARSGAEPRPKTDFMTLLMEKPYCLIAYEAPQAIRLSGGSSWAPPVVSGVKPQQKS